VKSDGKKRASGVKKDAGGSDKKPAAKKGGAAKSKKSDDDLDIESEKEKSEESLEDSA
jgi:hypothetical protein